MNRKIALAEARQARKCKWRCYVCGKKIGTQFILWSLMGETDRIFLCCQEKSCYLRLDRPTFAMFAVNNGIIPKDRAA